MEKCVAGSDLARLMAHDCDCPCWLCDVLEDLIAYDRVEATLRPGHRLHQVAPHDSDRLAPIARPRGPPPSQSEHTPSLPLALETEDPSRGASGHHIGRD
eukprot:4946291-Prymnesium_polylepis.2